MKKYKHYNEYVKELGDDIESLYIYSYLVNINEFPETIKDEESSMKLLITYIQATCLISKKRLGLTFICDVAMDYLDEILSHELEVEDFEAICEESLYDLD